MDELFHRLSGLFKHLRGTFCKWVHAPVGIPV